VPKSTIILTTDIKYSMRDLQGGPVGLKFIKY